MKLSIPVKQWRLLFGSLLAIGAVIGFVGFSGLAQAQTVTRECSPNSVINCGVLSIGELRTKFNSDFTPGTQTIFSFMGISSSTINNATVKTGFVTKTGLVTVNGATVASGAISSGRQNIAGSTQHVINGTTFFTRTPSVSFLQSQLDAFVFLDGNGRFIGAVIQSCGNAIKATPTPVPAPKPVPAPVPAPAPKPAIIITKMVDQKTTELVQVGKPFQFEIAVKNTGNATLTNVAVTDPAPTGVTFQSVSIGQITNNAWNYIIPSLAVGQTMDFTITAVVPSPVAGTLTNRACVDTIQIPGSPDSCAIATVEVAVPRIQVCELSTKQIVTINQSDFDRSRFSENMADCSSIQVCRLSDQKIITITTTEFNNNQSAFTTNLAACQPVVPMALVTPIAPTQLPLTGAGDTVVPLIGAGSLVASIGYYVSSRRALRRS